MVSIIELMVLFMKALEKPAPVLSNFMHVALMSLELEREVNVLENGIDLVDCSDDDFSFTSSTTDAEDTTLETLEQTTEDLQTHVQQGKELLQGIEDGMFVNESSAVKHSRGKISAEIADTGKETFPRAHLVPHSSLDAAAAITDNDL
jgi:hypothetical protein